MSILGDCPINPGWRRYMTNSPLKSLTDKEGREASSLERLIGLLDLFEEESQAWTPEAMLERLGYTRSTLYRYLKILTDAGILTSFPGIGYSLGPRIAELDYRMRVRDPLITSARPVMEELAADFSGIALLCRSYREKVLCVHQERGKVAFQSTYQRGRALPLLRGAASRVILAYLPPTKLARLFDQQADEFAAAGLGTSLTKVQAVLNRIRENAYDITTEQVTSGVTGIAAPVFDAQRNPIGSLSLTIHRKSAEADETRRIAERVIFAARITTKAIALNIESPAG